MRELILPYVERVKKSRLDAAGASAVDIVEANLKEITSPIIRTMQSFDLTPKEMEVVSYLRAGKATKQIAGLLGVSNMKELVFPYMEKLKKSGLTAGQASTVDIIETSLNEITSPFIRKMETLGLTAGEIAVASLLKKGRSTKELVYCLINIFTIGFGCAMLGHVETSR